jgi:hypothetical protein
MIMEFNRINQIIATLSPSMTEKILALVSKKGKLKPYESTTSTFGGSTAL